MTTSAQLADILIEATGLAAEDIRHRARRLREEGMLPKGGRGRGAPHVEAGHAVNLLIAAMAGGLQQHAPAAVRRISALVLQNGADLHTIWTGSPNVTAAERAIIETLFGAAMFSDEVRPRVRTFAGMLETSVEACCSSQGRQIIGRLFHEILVWHHGRNARITSLLEPDAALCYGVPDASAAQDMRRARAAPVSVLATIPARILEVLADAVLDTRARR